MHPIVAKLKALTPAAGFLVVVAALLGWGLGYDQGRLSATTRSPVGRFQKISDDGGMLLDTSTGLTCLSNIPGLKGKQVLPSCVALLDGDTVERIEDAAPR